MNRNSVLKFPVVMAGLLAGNQVWAQSCQGDADFGFFFNVVPEVVDGTLTSFPGTPGVVLFSTDADGPLRVEDVTNEFSAGDSVLRLYSLDTFNSAVSLIEENDDGGIDLRARIARLSAPAGDYCLDVRDFQGGFIDVQLEVEATRGNSNALPQCLQNEIAQFGYFDGRITPGSGGSGLQAVGTVRVETAGTLSVTGNGADMQIHPLNDAGGAVDLSVARSVNADTTYCVFERGNTFNQLSYQPTENIYENGFLQFPPNEVRLPEGGGASEIRVSLQNAITLPVTIDWQVDFNSDSNAADFTDTNFLGSFNSLQIAAGQTSVAIVVPINNDTVQEQAETTAIRFSNPNDVNFGAQVAAVNLIIEDDDTPVVNPVNRNPTFTTSIGQLNGQTGQLFSQTVTAVDLDNDPLNYNLTGTASSWLSVAVASDGRSATLSGTPVVAGNFNVNLTAEDGRGGSGNLAFSITVQGTGFDTGIDRTTIIEDRNNESGDSGGNSGGGSLAPGFLLLILVAGPLLRIRTKKA